MFEGKFYAAGGCYPFRYMPCEFPGKKGAAYLIIAAVLFELSVFLLKATIISKTVWG